MRPEWRNVEIVIHAVVICVACGYHPPLDHAIVASCAYLGLGRTATASKDDRTYNIKVASKGEANFEALLVGLGQLT
jgi:hypothetical protein